MLGSRPSFMVTILTSPFFLLFCATSGSATYLAHRLFVLKVRPGSAERILAILAALQSLALSFATHQMRLGAYGPAHIDPGAGALVTAITGLGVAAVCLECVLAGGEARS